MEIYPASANIDPAYGEWTQVIRIDLSEKGRKSTHAPAAPQLLVDHFVKSRDKLWRNQYITFWLTEKRES